MSVPLSSSVAVVGGGPAGLMAAEVLSAAGVDVRLFDAMPTVGRKFLLAGIGGLNLTHAEPLPAFQARFRSRAADVGRWLGALSPQDVRDWAQGLGIDTFVGSSQRVFPTDMKAAPLLRAWLHRLRHPGNGVPVTLHMRHRWDGRCEVVTDAQGESRQRLYFQTPNGEQCAEARAVLLALGGGSWAKLGSDGAWQPWLSQRGVPLEPLRPANCGFDVVVGPRPGWSTWLQEHMAGVPLKGVVMTWPTPAGTTVSRKGECVLTRHGLEGSLVYAASADVRDVMTQAGQATVLFDLKPDWPLERVLAVLAKPRAGRSLSKVLRSGLGLAPVHAALLHEMLDREALSRPERVAETIKAMPLTLVRPRPLDEAISSAGGVQLEALDEGLMVQDWPGMFCAGEMLDWEAPTGGYLLTACLASGRVAGLGMLQYLQD